jgi:hypothetical protein
MVRVRLIASYDAGLSHLVLPAERRRISRQFEALASKGRTNPRTTVGSKIEATGRAFQAAMRGWLATILVIATFVAVALPCAGAFVLVTALAAGTIERPAWVNSCARARADHPA